MHSLRTRITFLTVWMLALSVTVVTLVSVLFIRSNERRESDQLLLLLCETGERNIDYYFNSVQKSVGKVASFAESDLEGLELEQLQRHIERVEAYFEIMANKTNGVLTYYYRIDPAISDEVKGFWYTDLHGEGFVAHEVTDISLYDTQDTSSLVWFTVPKDTGEAIWLPPYITDNLDVRVISYNVPIYWRGSFIGVVGIETDYSALAEQVESIRLYNSGYAFLDDRQGNLFFHPHIDVALLTEETTPPVPDGILSDSTFLRYTYGGVEKQAAWLPLCNGMRLTVSVPVSETEGGWQSLVREIILVSVVVLLTLSAFTMLYTGRIARPLEKLTEAAEAAERGNYDFTLQYSRDDEVGRLTHSFQRLTEHIKDHISDLNRRVYLDALTSVKNKGAFSVSLDRLQERLDAGEGLPAFAVGVFDCDNLKAINDRFGHDKGDIYLKTGCQLICRVFKHSPVFRIGGDEFAVILQNEDFENRSDLVRQFYEAADAISAATPNQWEQVHVSLGVAEFDPRVDFFVVDAVRRADKIMYATQRARKEGKAHG